MLVKLTNISGPTASVNVNKVKVKGMLQCGTVRFTAAHEAYVELTKNLCGEQKKKRIM